jgi:hypothetical protein
MASCKDSPQPDKVEIYLKTTDPFPEHDAYLTFSGYDEKEQRFPYFSSHYIWNGEDIGIGTEGLKRWIEALKELPDGSKILVYPSNHMPWHMEFGGRDYPFMEKYDKVVTVLSQKKMVLYYSPWDHLGKPHPLCSAPAGWEEYKQERDKRQGSR